MREHCESLGRIEESSADLAGFRVNWLVEDEVSN